MRRFKLFYKKNKHFLTAQNGFLDKLCTFFVLFIGTFIDHDNELKDFDSKKGFGEVYESSIKNLGEETEQTFYS